MEETAHLFIRVCFGGTIIDAAVCRVYLADKIQDESSPRPDPTLSTSGVSEAYLPNSSNLSIEEKLSVAYIMA